MYIRDIRCVNTCTRRTGKHGGKKLRRGCRRMKKKIGQGKSFKGRRDNCITRIDDLTKTLVNIETKFQYLKFLPQDSNLTFLTRVESEGKTNAQIEANPTRDAYSEVYDWRPSVEKTDVIRTMEAIEGNIRRCSHIFFSKFKFVLVPEAETHPSQKDKSPWRKSSLNVPNSMEETDPRYSRRLRSRLSAENVLSSSSTLQVR